MGNAETKKKRRGICGPKKVLLHFVKEKMGPEGFQTCARATLGKRLALS